MKKSLQSQLKEQAQKIAALEKQVTEVQDSLVGCSGAFQLSVNELFDKNIRGNRAELTSLRAQVDALQARVSMRSLVAALPVTK